MDITQGFTASTIWTLAAGSVIAYLAGTILSDRFGLNAKTVGLVTAMLWTTAWAVGQFVPQAAGPLTIVGLAVVNGLIVYALAYMQSDVLGKLAELVDRRRAPEAESPESVSRETSPVAGGPQMASAVDGDDYTYSGTYETPGKTRAERLRW